CRYLRVVDFDAEAALRYGEIRAALKRAGQLIGDNDLLIAAHALALDAILVTNNTREFERVGGLKLENWL
ncbi:MAG: PIN domain-containing protein, partial [Moraxellaceae bacterium]